jgi:hypothetical protein
VPSGRPAAAILAGSAPTSASWRQDVLAGRAERAIVVLLGTANNWPGEEA